MRPARLFPLLLAALLPAQRSSSQGAPAAAEAALGGGGGGGGSSASRPRQYGVKLCGRDFIRAVIFTCGGSRWRRVSEEDEEEQPPPPPSRAPLARADLLQAKDAQLQLLLDAEPKQLQSVSPQAARQPLQDLLGLHEDCNEHIPISSNLKEYFHQLEDTTRKVKGSLGSDRLPWGIRDPRRKRDLSMGVAGICCNWGCTKTEISALC